MSTYVFSQNRGCQTDNINYIQIYKKRIFNKITDPIKYIFLKIPERKEINNYGKIGIDTEQLVNMYQFFSDKRELKLSIKTEDKLKDLKDILHYTRVIYHESEIQMVREGYVIATILLDEKDKDYFWGICYFSYMKLLRMEVYTDGIMYTNFYITSKSEGGLYAKLVRRSFYNCNGSVAYDQLLEEGKESFVFPDGRFYNKQEFINKFIKKLDLSKQDTIFLDYSVPIEFLQAVFRFGKVARIVALAPVKYDSFKNENLCYFWFPYSEALSTMIVSTDEQKKMLTKELKTYHCNIPDIRVAPIEGEFENTVLYESYDGNLALSWTFNGKSDGFWIYDEYGKLIYETRNIYQHYFLIKGYEKETGFVLKAFADTMKGKVVTAQSKQIFFSARKYDNATVSLVIPAYNSENYLVRTIDNALAQSFFDLEIIIVDDGSTDSTPDIIDWYAEKYANIVGIHKENGGTPAARNTGIEYSHGHYVGFLDNDDMIRPDMITRLYSSAEKYDCDISVTSVYTITENGYVCSVQYSIKEDNDIPIHEFFQAYMHGSELGVVVWNKLYRASLVKKYPFPILPYDDVAWTPYILSYAKNICYINGCFYEWDRTIRESTLLSKWDQYKKKEMFEFRKRAILFYLENGDTKKRGLLKESAKMYLLLWEKVYGYEEYRKLWEWIHKTF